MPSTSVIFGHHLFPTVNDGNEFADRYNRQPLTLLGAMPHSHGVCGGQDPGYTFLHDLPPQRSSDPVRGAYRLNPEQTSAVGTQNEGPGRAPPIQPSPGQGLRQHRADEPLFSGSFPRSPHPAHDQSESHDASSASGSSTQHGGGPPGSRTIVSVSSFVS